MSEGIAINSRDYESAVGEATRRKEQLRQAKAEIEALKARNAELEKDLGDALEGFEAAQAEAGEWQQKYESSPDEWRAKYEDAQKQLRERDLRSRFDKTARGKVRDDALDAAWKLAGLSADGDLDDDGLGKAIGDLVSSNAFLAHQPDPADTGSRGADASGKPGGNGGLSASAPGPGLQRGSVNASGPNAAHGAHPGLAAASSYLEKTGRAGQPGRIA